MAVSTNELESVLGELITAVRVFHATGFVSNESL